MQCHVMRECTRCAEEWPCQGIFEVVTSSNWITLDGEWWYSTSDFSGDDMG